MGSSNSPLVNAQSIPSQKLTFKASNKKNCSRRQFIYFLLLSFEKIRLDVSCESSAYIHTKYQVFFSLKNNEKVFINVVCCSHDWRLKGYINRLTEYKQGNEWTYVHLITQVYLVIAQIHFYLKIKNLNFSN